MIGAPEQILADVGHGLHRQVMPLEPVSLEALFDALPAEDAIYWASEGETIVGLGAARTFRASGDARFARLREQTAGLPSWARVFSAFAFAPARGPSPLPDAWAILPRFLVRQRGGKTELSLAIDDATPRDAFTAFALALTSARAARPEGDHLVTGAPEAAHDDFAARVVHARARIVRGELDKVVLHRQTRVARTGPPCVAPALSRLAIAQRHTTRYAMRVHGRVFLGATPERLVSRRGDRVRADVLAGSLPRTPGARRAELMRSAKDRAEHELTRHAIVEALRPFCDPIVETGPTVRSLPHVHHLATKIRATLRSDRHILELVETLHPTPAVGGVPRKAALELIAAEEHSRLWYAGPIGWFQPSGDGDFRVALRCALLDDHHATLFAGAGIVAASDPEREAAEIAAKQQAMASALGLVAGSAP